jgi:hypothetical protein
MGGSARALGGNGGSNGSSKNHARCTRVHGVVIYLGRRCCSIRL